jgi:hypothetical protein
VLLLLSLLLATASAFQGRKEHIKLDDNGIVVSKAAAAVL